MARPKKCRQVGIKPRSAYFKPAGIPLSKLEQIELTFEEMEAIRLADFEGAEQSKTAGKMRISQPTFSRILKEGRRKVAEALFRGKAICIIGGNYHIGKHEKHCRCIEGGKK
ncbi:MAG: DUF134 domain-containing protein [Candidatus Micrarchaeota archaeon]